MRIIIIVIFSICFTRTFSQNWSTSANSPQNSERLNDVFFINNNEGWIVSGYGVKGILLHTIDGGINWDTIYQKEYSHFRSLYFFDSNNGIITTVGADVYPAGFDTIPIYYTTDGGHTFTPSIIRGDVVKGICNISAIHETIMGTGRVGGGSFWVKSKDMGKTWYAQNMSKYLGTAIDVYFDTYYNGYILGGTDSLLTNSYPIIIRTNDGGSTWDTVGMGSKKGALAWKCFFVNDSVAYATILDHKNKSTFFKTTNYGNSWQCLPLIDSIYGSKGLFFLNENMGWIGGDKKSNALYTADGGSTWSVDSFLGTSINRIRKLDNKLVAVGNKFWIYVP